MNTKKLSFNEIKNRDTPAVAAIIDYWKDFDQETVIFAFYELKYRDFNLDKKLTSRLDEFCFFNELSDIEKGYESFYKIRKKPKEISGGFETMEESDIVNYVLEPHIKSYAAQSMISGLLKGFAALSFALTIVIMLWLGTISVLFSLIAIIIGFFIVIVSYTFAELILLFIQIEQNTRAKK